MYIFSGWRWTHWILLAAGVVYLASYFGLMSHAEETINWLISRPGIRDAIRPSLDREDALFVLLSFLVLTVPAIFIAVVLLGFVFAVLTGTVAPVGRMLGLPEWILQILVGAVLLIAAYVRIDLWLPWILWAVGLVTSAWVIASS
ncbi:MAG: hypothetical protein HY727_19365 [Candidatus Rokubacteria bacterium]|nr:hypothetical protein [Candidatus Rokubacteria bacterium]